MEQELEAIERNKTWEFVTPPSNSRVIDWCEVVVQNQV